MIDRTKDKVVDKDSYDKNAIESAKLKKLLSDKQTEEEKRAELEKTRNDELESLRNELKRNKFIAKLDPSIYTEQEREKYADFYMKGEAEKLAEAMTATVKAYGDKREKDYREKAMQDPKLSPSKGKDPRPITKEQFDKMGYTDRMKLNTEQPELYKQFTQK